MNYSRLMGMLWGIMIGLCLGIGATYDPRMFVAAIIPITGIWMFRKVT